MSDNSVNSDNSDNWASGAPAYAMSLPKSAREQWRERLRKSLPIATDGKLPLTARAWAARSTVRKVRPS